MMFVVLIFGLIVGSFLNALIYRLHTGESVMAGRSRCAHCKHELGASDLIPVVSFFVLRGRCRYCSKKISWQYPLVEIATAVAFLLISDFQFPISNTNFWFLAIFSSFLIVIFVYDLKHFLILDKIVYPAAAIALLYQIWLGNLSEAVYGALFLAGFFGVLYLVSRGRWIGLGDVKLGLFLGLLVPWPETLVLFFLAYMTGAIVGVGLIGFGSKTLKSRLPFGVFLTLGAFVAMIWGENIVNWYSRLIGF